MRKFKKFLIFLIIVDSVIKKDFNYAPEGCVKCCEAAPVKDSMGSEVWEGLIIIETASFDLQKRKADMEGLKQPEGVDYQRGESFGF